MGREKRDAVAAKTTKKTKMRCVRGIFGGGWEGVAESAADAWDRIELVDERFDGRAAQIWS